jgi:hypothetical protein
MTKLPYLALILVASTAYGVAEFSTHCFGSEPYKRAAYIIVLNANKTHNTVELIIPATHVIYTEEREDAPRRQIVGVLSDYGVVELQVETPELPHEPIADYSTADFRPLHPDDDEQPIQEYVRY